MKRVAAFLLVAVALAACSGDDDDAGSATSVTPLNPDTCAVSPEEVADIVGFDVRAGAQRCEFTSTDDAHPGGSVTITTADYDGEPGTVAAVRSALECKTSNSGSGVTGSCPRASKSSRRRFAPTICLAQQRETIL